MNDCGEATLPHLQEGEKFLSRSTVVYSIGRNGPRIKMMPYVAVREVFAVYQRLHHWRKQPLKK